MDQAFLGRSFPFAEPYEVGIEKIRQFAEAIGDDNLLYHDRVAAQHAGHPSVVAPPTFAIQVIARAQDAVMFDPALGLDFSRVVHLDQRFEHLRAIYAGDVLSCVVTVESIKVLAGNDVLTVRTDVTDIENAPVCSAWGTLVSRAAAS
nr:MaoC family dehydratase N-terminal domain-containing protein [Nakamurella antarctica]